LSDARSKHTNLMEGQSSLWRSCATAAEVVIAAAAARGVRVRDAERALLRAVFQPSAPMLWASVEASTGNKGASSPHILLEAQTPGAFVGCVGCEDRPHVQRGWERALRADSGGTGCDLILCIAADRWTTLGPEEGGVGDGHVIGRLAHVADGRDGGRGTVFVTPWVADGSYLDKNDRPAVRSMRWRFSPVRNGWSRIVLADGSRRQLAFLTGASTSKRGLLSQNASVTAGAERERAVQATTRVRPGDAAVSCIGHARLLCPTEARQLRSDARVSGLLSLFRMTASGRLEAAAESAADASLLGGGFGTSRVVVVGDSNVGVVPADADATELHETAAAGGIEVQEVRVSLGSSSYAVRYMNTTNGTSRGTNSSLVTARPWWAVGKIDGASDVANRGHASGKVQEWTRVGSMPLPEGARLRWEFLAESEPQDEEATRTTDARFSVASHQILSAKTLDAAVRGTGAVMDFPDAKILPNGRSMRVRLGLWDPARAERFPGGGGLNAIEQATMNAGSNSIMRTGFREAWRWHLSHAAL
jgi:hypothetical protein